MSERLTDSPFHRGERDLQSRAGVRDQIEDVGQRFIRDFLPDEHREFYEQLPYVLIGSVDGAGRPWASILAGQPGFIQSPDERTLEVATARIAADPLNANLVPGAPIGILGLDYAARRRNRLTARVAAVDASLLSLDVVQSFGNCPQYIQAREVLQPDGAIEPGPVHSLKTLDDRARAIVTGADHFFIATHFDDSEDKASRGADVSHRGGRPGFVRIEEDGRLVFPDFSGNFHFNTLGNIALNPRAGLLFIDFECGDLLYLTCGAEIIWDSEERRAFEGAEQLVSFTVDEGLLAERALPLQWRFVDCSPSLDKTGSWAEVEETLAARHAENVYCDYTVTRIEKESEVISSFYLEPADGSPLHCHHAGQFLPIAIHPPGHDELLKRTYTISNAPNSRYYRLSIKREPAPEPSLPAGLSSNYFHHKVEQGAVIRALSPRGHFVLDESSTRPVVLLSGGVGITPMISMLEQLAATARGCGCTRKVWFIHGARHGSEHAFRAHVSDVAADWDNCTVHYRYSAAAADDVIGRDYDSAGRVDMELLKSLLPFDDYDFYFCGPPAFMQSMYEGLKELNVADERIHYEFFGPGATLLREQPGESEGLVDMLTDAAPVTVKFAKAGLETVWDPSRGTLLDLAESEGLQPAYSCRSGICQTCSTRISTGEVQYVDPPLAEPEAGEALICCCYPAASCVDGITLDL